MHFLERQARTVKRAEAHHVVTELVMESGSVVVLTAPWHSNGFLKLLVKKLVLCQSANAELVAREERSCVFRAHRGLLGGSQRVLRFLRRSSAFQ